MSLIVPFDPWKNNLCSCPAKYSLSAYTGCDHFCLYCYASSYIKNFHSPRPKKEFLRRLEKDIKKIPPNSSITIANSSDPYLPLEKELKLTRAALKIIRSQKIQLMIVTKSSLVLRDIDILCDIKLAVISLSFTTLDTALAKRLEPFASTPMDKLKTIEKLSKKLPVICRLDPLIYPLNTDKIRKIVKEFKKRGVKQIITSTYKAKPDNLKRMFAGFPEYKRIWYKLYIEKGGRFGRYIYLPEELRRKLIEEVRQECLKENIDFSTCREGFSRLNTKSCDGSSFLKDTV
ncbi:MAG: radical SAM protein [Candidatus Omnitrophota bacterium]